MKTKNAEVTGKKVASIAGRILAVRKKYPNFNLILGKDATNLDWDDIEAVAASCLTQREPQTVARTKGPQPGETVRTVKARKK